MELHQFSQDTGENSIEHVPKHRALLARVWHEARHSRFALQSIQESLGSLIVADKVQVDLHRKAVHFVVNVMLHIGRNFGNALARQQELIVVDGDFESFPSTSEGKVLDDRWHDSLYWSRSSKLLLIDSSTRRTRRLVSL